jgi:glutamate racemase
VYRFTLQAVKRLFDEGCPLVILACNTASAKALRTIQQRDLPLSADPSRRVLGIIRPTVEALGALSKTWHIGVTGTDGTISSGSYSLEITKLYPDMKVTGEACPMWVPLVENREHEGDGADYFVRKNLEHLFASDPQIDTLVLGCTHYPLLEAKIRMFVPENVSLFFQGPYVAESLKDSLFRHPEMSSRLSENKSCRFMTTESGEKFSEAASLFLGCSVDVKQIIMYS